METKLDHDLIQTMFETQDYSILQTYKFQTLITLSKELDDLVHSQLAPKYFRAIKEILKILKIDDKLIRWMYDHDDYDLLVGMSRTALIQGLTACTVYMDSPILIRRKYLKAYSKILKRLTQLRGFTF
jgi:hypothetical protein